MILCVEFTCYSKILSRFYYYTLFNFQVNGELHAQGISPGFHSFFAEFSWTSVEKAFRMFIQDTRHSREGGNLLE